MTEARNSILQARNTQLPRAAIQLKQHLDRPTQFKRTRLGPAVEAMDHCDVFVERQLAALR